MSLLIFHNAKRAFNLEKSIYCTTNLGKVKLLKKTKKKSVIIFIDLCETNK